MKNVIFLIIDGLRYDVARTPESLRSIAPNLARLADAGFVRKVIANAQATQFVMPSIFTMSYPLDYGGYNDGIAGRPKSFVDLIKNAGYRTIQFSTCNQLGLSNGYQAGFDVIGMTSDYRTMLETRIARGTGYFLGRWKRGEISDVEFFSILQKDLGKLFDAMVEQIHQHDTSIWPPKLKRINDKIAQGCKAEKALLFKEPNVVALKLDRIAAGLYWRYLGEREISQWRLLPRRILSSLSWRSRDVIARQNIFPFLTLQNYQAIFGDVVDRVADNLTSRKGRPWFLFMHMMDLHDCRALNRPLYVLKRLKFFPTWLSARFRGLTFRRFLYDSALMYVDECLGKLLAKLDEAGEDSNSVILVTGDHGQQYAESPRWKTPLGERMHYEDIEAPLIVSGAERQPSAQSGLIDSRGVTATLLQILNIPPHPSFATSSAYGEGLNVVISESCGRGASDLAHRDIFFAVTSRHHRLFATLSQRRLVVTKLFDLDNDPREVTDVLHAPGNRTIINQLLKGLFEEREALFRMRGICRPPVWDGSIATDVLDAGLKQQCA